MVGQGPLAVQGEAATQQPRRVPAVLGRPAIAGLGLPGSPYTATIPAMNETCCGPRDTVAAAPGTPGVATPELVLEVRWGRFAGAWAMKLVELAVVVLAATRVPYLGWAGAAFYGFLAAIYATTLAGSVRQRARLARLAPEAVHLVSDTPVATTPCRRALSGAGVVLFGLGAILFLVRPGLAGVDGPCPGGAPLIGAFVGAHVLLGLAQLLAVPTVVTDAGILTQGTLVPWTACTSFASRDDAFTVRATVGRVNLDVRLPKDGMADPCDVGRFVEDRVRAAGGRVEARLTA